jgi:hypothetical protein
MEMMLSHRALFSDPQVSLEEQLHQSLLASLSLTTASAKQPVIRLTTMDIKTTKKKSVKKVQKFGARANKKTKTGALA